jgi:hypothetical protein
MAQKRLTIDDLPEAASIADSDLIVGRDSSGDFQTTYNNSLAERDSTGYRNYIIDGDFNFWSNGTSFSAVNYTADMWYWQEQAGGGGVGTVSRQLNFDSTIENYFLRLEMTSAAAAVFISQKLKDISLLAGKDTSMFIKAKSSTGVTSLAYQLIRYDGSIANSSITSNQTIPAQDTWSWYRFDLTIPDTSGLTITAGNYTEIRIRNNANETFTLDIDKVRVIETPENLQADEIPEWIKADENPLAVKPLVRQYYIKMVGDATSFGTFALCRGSAASYTSSTSAIANQMVQTPTISQSNVNALSVTAGADIALGGGETITNEFSTNRFATFRFNDAVGSNFITNHGYHLEFDNTGYLEFDARY